LFCFATAVLIGYAGVLSTNAEKRRTDEVAAAHSLLDPCCPSLVELGQAKAKLDEVLRGDPHNRFALLESARLELKSGSLGYAFMRNNGANRYSVNAYRDGTLERAEPIVRNLISINPNFGDAYSYLAFIRMNDHGIDEAEYLLSKAEALGSTDPFLDIRWTIVLFAEGKFEDGRAHLHRIFQSPTANARVKRQAVDLTIDDVIRQREYEEGKKIYEQALATYPDDINLRTSFAGYLSDYLDLNDQAIAIATKPPSIVSSGSGRRILAFALYREWAVAIAKGNRKEADNYFAQAQELYSDLDQVMLHAGSAPASNKLVDALVNEKGVSIEAADSDGSTTLLIATNQDFTDVVRFLLSRHANPNVQDANGWTPLLSAAQDGNRELAAMLISAGADPNVTMNGKPPAAFAMENNNTEMAMWLDGLRQQ